MLCKDLNRLGLKACATTTLNFWSSELYLLNAGVPSIHVPPIPLYGVLRSKSRALCTPVKHSTNWVTILDPCGYFLIQFCYIAQPIFRLPILPQLSWCWKYRSISLGWANNQHYYYYYHHHHLYIYIYDIYNYGYMHTTVYMHKSIDNFQGSVHCKFQGLNSGCLLGLGSKYFYLSHLAGQSGSERPTLSLAK